MCRLARHHSIFMKRLPPLILACLLATWIIWGSTYLAIRFALPGFPPYWQMATRFLVAGLLLLGWCLWRGTPLPNSLQWRNAFIIGGLMLGFGMGNTARAEQTVASGLIVAFVAIMPLLITAGNACYGLRPSGRELIGMLIGMVGIAILIRGHGFAASPQGLVAIAVAVTCWSVGSVLSQRTFLLAPGAMGFASEMLAGSIVLFAMSLLAGEQPNWSPPWHAVVAWVYLVIFGSLMAFNAYMVLLSRAGASLAASYTFVNPVIAMLLGVSLGGEVISTHEWLAAGVIVFAVTLLVTGRKPATTEQTSNT